MWIACGEWRFLREEVLVYTQGLAVPLMDFEKHARVAPAPLP